MTQQPQQQQKPRRPKAFVGSLTTNHLFLRNPFMMAWLSATFPGFGHISLGNYVTGMILFIWEMLANTMAKINLAILYSFTGRYDMAKEILNNRWLLLYAPVYVFAMWDTYRRTVKYNQYSLLADRAEQMPTPVAMSSVEINSLDKRSPWVAVAWTLLAPGLGHIYSHRMVTGFFLLIWWIVSVYNSLVLQAVQYTALGLFEQAKAVVDPQWLIYLPQLLALPATTPMPTPFHSTAFSKRNRIFFGSKVTKALISKCRQRWGRKCILQVHLSTQLNWSLPFLSWSKKGYLRSKFALFR